MVLYPKNKLITCYKNNICLLEQTNKFKKIKSENLQGG